MLRALPLPVCLVLTAHAGLAAQDVPHFFPQLSPRATTSQVIGTTTVTLDYHRPAVRGRQIWGGLVPYGQVWRTGANEATTIRFSDAVKVNGHSVPAGTYALFTVPGPEQWTVILNKRAKQFGAFEYVPKEDLLRFDVKPKAVNHTEWLTFDINPASRSSAYVDLYWEKVRVSFLLDVDVDAMVTARMKRAIAKAEPDDWRIFCDSASYLLEQEMEIPQALQWIDRSIRIQENPTNLYVKARLLRLAGKFDESWKVLDRALGQARAQKAGPVVIKPMELTQSQWRGQAPAQGNGHRR